MKQARRSEWLWAIQEKFWSCVMLKAVATNVILKVKNIRLQQVIIFFSQFTFTLTTQVSLLREISNVIWSWQSQIHCGASLSSSRTSPWKVSQAGSYLPYVGIDNPESSSKVSNNSWNASAKAGLWLHILASLHFWYLTKLLIPFLLAGGFW